MTVKSTHNSKLSLNVQYDYITLKTPNGNFTNGRYGAKASGKLASHPTAFKNIDDFCQASKDNILDVMKKLLDPEQLAALWPEWDETLNIVSVGDTVVPTGPFAKKYPQPGVVVSVKRKTAYVKFSTEVIGFDMGFLTKKSQG